MDKMPHQPTVDSCIALLTSEAAETRLWAAEWLGDEGDRRAFAALARVARDDAEDRHVRTYAIRGLGRLGDERAFPILMTLLDAGGDLRGEAAFALGLLGHEQAFAPLAQAVRVGAADLRAMAAAGLGSLGDKRAVALLIEALADPDEYVRVCAIAALGCLRDARASAPLAALLHDEQGRSEYEAEQAARSLGRIGGDDAEMAIQWAARSAMSGAVRKAATKALARQNRVD